MVADTNRERERERVREEDGACAYGLTACRDLGIIKYAAACRTMGQPMPTSWSDITSDVQVQQQVRPTCSVRDWEPHS